MKRFRSFGWSLTNGDYSLAVDALAWLVGAAIALAILR